MKSHITLINRLIEEVKETVYISVMPKDYTFTPVSPSSPTYKQINAYCNSRQKKQRKSK